MTRTGAAARPDFEERTESIADWVQTHTRQLLIALMVIVALAAGAFLYTKLRETRSQRAVQSLAQAEQAYASGNEALARSEIQRVVFRYHNTEQAVQATLLLAQLS